LAATVARHARASRSGEAHQAINVQNIIKAYIVQTEITKHQNVLIVNIEYKKNYINYINYM